MKKIYILCYFFLLVDPGFSQKSREVSIDSLVPGLSQLKDDTNKVHLLLEAFKKYAETDQKAALNIAEEALSVSKEIKWNQGLMESYYDLSSMYWVREDWVKVIESAQSALDLADASTPKIHVFNLYSILGATYIYLEIYPLALENFEKALNTIKEIGDEESYNITLGNIGWVYYNMGDYRAALRFGRQNLESSLKYDNKQDIANCYAIGGLIFLKLDQPDSAILFFNKALLMPEYIEKTFLSTAINGLGEVYFNKKDYERALDYFSQARVVGEEHKNYSSLQDIYLNLSKTYEALNNTSAALESYKKYHAYMDTSNTAVKQHEVAFLELQNETRKKDVLQQATLERQTLIRNASIGGLLLAVILVLVLVLRFSEKKRANRQLRRTLHQLKATQDQLIQQEKLVSLGQLTAGVAHEINNPINFVSANVNPLKRNFHEIKKLLSSYEQLISGPAEKEMIEKLKKESGLDENISESESLLKGIEEGSRRTAEIVRGLRNFSRADEEVMKKANINEGIESTLILLQNKLKHQNIRIEKSLEDIPEIDGYPGQLNQVLMNLLVNAIDAIGDEDPSGLRERKISIKTHAENNVAIVSIRDTGDGMSEDVKKKLFDPFFTTKDVGKGTGLGLSISYGIIQKHHGKIEVKSEIGKGTEFIIHLPVLQKK